LRLSVSGAVIFLVSIVALIFLPNAVPIAGILLGGMLVWIGFIWTLLSYYVGTKPPSES
jgi:hypothetical protein